MTVKELYEITKKLVEDGVGDMDVVIKVEDEGSYDAEKTYVDVDNYFDGPSFVVYSS